MLKKIPTADVRLGMHLHRLDGAWIDHPFWKTKFTLSSADDLHKLRGSAVPFVWIDNELGLDVADAANAGLPSPGRAAPAPAPVSGPRGPSLPSASAPTAASDSMHAELNRAAAICKRSRSAVLSMFNEARLGKAVDAEQLPAAGR